MISDKELIDKIYSMVLGEYSSLITKGPFTTLYWDNIKKDNVPQQSLSVEIDGKTFDILVREKE